jgi:hypothetical protein
MGLTPRQQHMVAMTTYLQDRMRAPDVSGEVIIRRNEVGEFGRSAGMDEEEAWQMFTKLQGLAWSGQFVPESRSEERGYTAARLMWVHPGL